MSNEEILVGAKEICAFLKIGPRKLREWLEKYPEMPVIKDGTYHSNARALSEWQARMVARIDRNKAGNA